MTVISNRGSGLLCVLAGFGLLATPCGFASPRPADGESESNIRGSKDTICGPRCVHYVLKHYCQDEDLIAIVREMQGADLSTGTTLEDIRQALKKRGIHAEPLGLAEALRATWPYPVVVHLHDTEGTGHFAVWLPGTDDRRKAVWLGLSGVREIDADGLLSRCSNTVLLTSPLEITPSKLPQATRTWLLWLIAAATAGLGLTLLVWPWVKRGTSRCVLFQDLRRHKE